MCICVFTNKGVCYMSPFWNHILANLAGLSMCLSQMYWYLQSMYLGTKGEFFFRLVYFWCSPSRFAVVIFSTARTNSNTPIYFGMTAYALATSARTICHHIQPIDAVTSTSTLVNPHPLPHRTIEFIRQPHTSLHHWIHATDMAKNPAHKRGRSLLGQAVPRGAPLG